MAYTWTNGELITAEKLNNTGGSTTVVTITYDQHEGYSADKTYLELAAVIEGGGNIAARVFGENGDLQYLTQYSYYQNGSDNMGSISFVGPVQISGEGGVSAFRYVLAAPDGFMVTYEQYPGDPQ